MQFSSARFGSAAAHNNTICSANQSLTPVCPSVLCEVFFMSTVSVTSDPEHRGQQAEGVLEQNWEIFHGNMTASCTGHKSMCYINNKSIAQLVFV